MANLSSSSSVLGQNYRYYTAIQALTPEKERVSIDEFIWNAITNCAAGFPDKKVRQFALKKGYLERNSTHMYQRRHFGTHALGVITDEPSSLNRGAFLTWVGVALDTMSINCASWQSRKDTKIRFDEKFISACDRTKKSIPFAENRMLILESIPLCIIQGCRSSQFKTRETSESFILFPHNYPHHQQPIALARKWVVEYCDLARLCQNDEGNPLLGPIECTLPTFINGITDNVASALDYISSDLRFDPGSGSDFAPSPIAIGARQSPIAILSTSWIDPITQAEVSLNQDEFDVAIAILQYLGVEIA